MGRSTVEYWIEMDVHMKNRNLGAGEKAQQLRALTAFQRTQVQFLAPTLDGAKLPITPASDISNTSDLQGYCGYR